MWFFSSFLLNVIKSTGFKYSARFSFFIFSISRRFNSIAVKNSNATAQPAAAGAPGSQFGARPLKRTLQKQILDPLALQLLEGDFVEGDRIVIDQKDDGRIIFIKGEKE